jgi:hypothetical protein
MSDDNNPNFISGFATELKATGKMLAYAMMLLVYVWILFRVAVPFLWGLALPLGLGPVFAIAVLIGGTLGGMFLLYVMVRDVWKFGKAANTTEKDENAE